MATPKNVPVIFQHGANQGIDKRVLPEGWFSTAQNIRFRKDGRVGKRFGYQTRALTSPSGTLVDGPFQAIATHKNTPLVISDGVVWPWDGLQWNTVLSGSEPLTVVSDYEPTRKTMAAVDEERNTTQPAVESVNGYRYIAWANNAGLFVRCENEATGAVVFIQRLDGGGTATEPRLTREVSAGERVICVWRDGTSIKSQSCDTSSAGSPITPVSFGNAQTLANATATAAAGFDITEGSSGGYYFLVYQSGVDQLTLAKCSSAGVAASANWVDIVDTLPASVFFGGHGTPGATQTVVYVVWRQAGTGIIRGRAYLPGAGAGAPTSPTASININILATNTSRPVGVFTRVDGGINGNAVAMWSGVVAGQPRMYVHQLEYIPGGPTLNTLSTLTTHYEFRNVSRPWVIDYGAGGGVFVWTHAGRSTSIQPVFALYEPTWDDGFGRVHMRQAYGAAYYVDHPVRAVQSSPGGVLGDWNWVYPEIIRGFNDGTPSVGTAVLQYSHRNERPSRAVTQFGDSTYIAGGWLTQFDGRLTAEQGFAWAPEILTFTEATGGGALAAGQIYQYVAVYEWVDTQGNRHQSAPSRPKQHTVTGANNQVTLAVTALDGATLRRAFNFQIAEVVLHVYRTTNLGRVFLRVTPDTGVPRAAGIPGVTGYVDGAADATILDNESLYAQGGTLPHATPPACGHVWGGRTRLCVSRLADRSLVQFSKVLVPGEPAQWADNDAYRSYVPGEVECTAEMDGVWFIFTKTEIYAVQGDGPDDKGQGNFADPIRVPSPVGCNDWRSLVEVPQGLMFFGGPGIYLLPRGGGAPVWVGQALRDSLSPAATVFGAAYDPEENVAVFGVLEPGVTYRILVYDVRNGEWSTDTLPAAATELRTVGAWVGRAAFGSATGLWARDTTLYFDTASAAVTQTLQTGEVSPFGPDGFGRVRRLSILGEYRGDALLTASAYYDGEDTPSTASWRMQATAASVPDFGTWTLSNMTRLAFGGLDPDGGTGAFTLTDTNDAGVPKIHQAFASGTNMVAGVSTFELWVSPVAGDFVRLQGQGSTGISYQFSTQTFGGAALCTASLLGTLDLTGVGSGIWHHILVEVTAGTTTTLAVYTAADLTGSVTYAGTATRAVRVYHPINTQNSYSGLTPGERFEVQWDLPRQKLTSLSVKVTDGAITGTAAVNNGEGLVFHGMTLGKLADLGGVSRLPAAARV